MAEFISLHFFIGVNKPDLSGDVRNHWARLHALHLGKHE